MISLLESMSFDETEWNKLVQEMHQQPCYGQATELLWPDLDDTTRHIADKADAQMDHFSRILLALEALDSFNRDPLARMTCHRDAPGLTDRLPDLGMTVPKTEPEPAPTGVVRFETSKRADAGLLRVADQAHRFGGWGA